MVVKKSKWKFFIILIFRSINHPDCRQTGNHQPTMSNNLRYPIGPFIFRPGKAAEKRDEDLARLRSLPERLDALVAGMTASQLATPYRPGGWTARQVIHHLADSHLNAYIRTKWTLTEKTPVIKAYDEAAWADLADVEKTPVAVSIAILESLHHRWCVLLETLTKADWQRAFFHPEQGRLVPLTELLASYAWHGDHHLAHIRLVKGRQQV